MLKKTKRWLAFICVLIGVFLALYKIAIEPSTFLTTRSPRETYTVNLMGQKERPRIFTVEVRFDVLKNGKSFWSDQYLHSGDAFDLSFEAGYPNHRWLDENILHFYREENFDKGKSQIVIVFNKTDKPIKYLKVETDRDKFLLFDIQPETKTKLSISSPQSGSTAVSVEGEFYEGGSFKNRAGFETNERINESFTYHVYITNNDLIIESPQLEKYINSSN